MLIKSTGGTDDDADTDIRSILIWFVSFTTNNWCTDAVHDISL